MLFACICPRHIVGFIGDYNWSECVNGRMVVSPSESASHPMTVGISSSLCDPELYNRKKMDGWMDAKRPEETGHQAEIDSHDPNFPNWTGLQQYTWCYLRNGLPSVNVWMAVWRHVNIQTHTLTCAHTMLHYSPFKATYSLLIISNGSRQRWQNKLKDEWKSNKEIWRMWKP